MSMRRGMLVGRGKGMVQIGVAEEMKLDDFGGACDCVV
jgi:hypothetical protein